MKTLLKDSRQIIWGTFNSVSLKILLKSFIDDLVDKQM